MSLRHSMIADYFYRIVDVTLIPVLTRLVPDPNLLTWMGMLLAALVPVGFWLHPAAGLLFILLSCCADVVDGRLARKRGQESAFGAFLDSTLDRVSDALFLCGFWVLFREREGVAVASVLILFGMLFTVLISYTKARAEALGAVCDKGLLERGWRNLYLIGWAGAIWIVPAASGLILWAGLILFCVLALVTVAQRMRQIRIGLNGQELGERLGF
jgi:CDP-diacylglycerol--glycerol-3-phosphate 3-phosphatidyltransferase